VGLDALGVEGAIDGTEPGAGAWHAHCGAMTGGTPPSSSVRMTARKEPMKHASVTTSLSLLSIAVLSAGGCASSGPSPEPERDPAPTPSEPDTIGRSELATDVKFALVAADFDLWHRVRVRVGPRRDVFLSGDLDPDEARRVERIARGVNGVRSVTFEATGPPDGPTSGSESGDDEPGVRR